MRSQHSGASLRESPNFNDRKPDVSLQYIVLHYTGSKKDSGEWIAAVCDPKVELSAHYLVKQSGQIIQLVDESKRAWHAGKSYWRGITDMNSASIGIELSNPGHPHDYQPFPVAQIHALKNLIRDIVQRNNLDAALALLAHSDIAPTRKEDPGELFPWQDLAQEGLGLWPEPEEQDYASFDDREAAVLLRAIGYDCPVDTFKDPIAQATLLAFQRRYHPQNLTGVADAETVARLRALKALQAARTATGSHAEGPRPAD